MIKANEVKITVQGAVGSAKTSLLALIERMLVDRHVPTEWQDQASHREAQVMLDETIQENLRMYRPAALLVERNHFQALDDIVPLALNIMERIEENPDPEIKRRLYDKLDEIQKDLNNMMSQIDLSPNEH